MNELKRQQIMRRIEQHNADQLQLAPDQAIPKACGFEAAIQTADKEIDLKKQSQFAPALMGVTSFVKGDYGSKSADGVHENKANQSQFHAPALTKGAGKREKSLAAANSLIG